MSTFMKDQKNRAKPRYIDYVPMPKEMIFVVAVGLVLVILEVVL